MRIAVLILPVFLCLCAASCDPKSVETDLSQSFSKIYDRPDTISYTAVDIEQTGDDGYIILAMADEHPYLLKVDKQGDFLWDTNNGKGFEDYVRPVPELLALDRENTGNQTYYFFCSKTNSGNEMNRDHEISSNNQDPIPIILGINEQDKNEPAKEIKISFKNHYEIWGTTNYSIKPLHASITDEDNYLLITSNNWGDSVTFIGDGNDNINWKVEDEDEENGVEINDLTYWAGFVCYTPYPQTDRRFHYAGKLEKMDKYYFQTYRRNSSIEEFSGCFRIRMEAPDGGTISPEIDTHRPLTAVEWDDSQWNVSNWDGTQWEGLKLSGAYIEDGNNIYLFVNAKVIMNEKTHVPQIDLSESEAQPHPELLEMKPVFIKTVDINGQQFTFFAGTTENDQIALYAYNASGNMPSKPKYFGEVQSYEAAGLIKTKDNGLAILGTTYILDRVKRICLFKLSAEELEEIVDKWQ